MADTLDSMPATSNQHDLASAPVKKNPSTPGKSNPRSSGPRGPPLHQIYALPAPIRTFPLPSFYPSNPVSLFHVVYTWVSQFISPPPAEPAVVHQGIWSPETRSIQIKDLKSIRALWEQGFFGKGNYSRSEPNWFKREQARKGQHHGHVAEDFTTQRREERKLMKWDRARKEQEAIQRTRLQEAWVAPVGPMELLALPNSEQDRKLAFLNAFASINLDIGATELNGALPVAEEDAVSTTPQMNGHSSHLPTPPDTGKSRKTVRFSPKVESTTFQLSDPPAPSAQSNGNGHAIDGTLPNGTSPLSQPKDLGISAAPLEESHVPKASSESGPVTIDREHLQLCLEETFYLAFALGALTVTDPATGKQFTPSDLFTLCRQMSYVPPRKTNLQPDDPFLINYAVYHHFRSLGWVTRPGIKFGVDWMLYNRGPVFSHAEFAVIVLPAYTDPWWKAEGRQPPQKSWHWLHTLNRVQTTALKTLVLAYVDIPPPFEEQTSAADILRRYKVREFIVKRWLSNRNRD
ncbi:hypothetical protein F4821DRAFT_179411 [Hypoxylon rubiginosum]|uniref:Uncharacterized protein n=1 Tax=Hypoxylon rubiginosum TaxID=110542 RepID=A0ACC0CUM8_9PEZI|nr:hypothetical protein F4821DRAFT_179411 [Hypoxylon rubiginosum]